MKGLRPGHVPLERALSKLGIASRTKARAWILEGRVRVNGVVRVDPGYGVSPEKARIEVDGARIEQAEPRVILLHKPRGVVTTASDEKGRRTVLELVAGVGAHLSPVGRLDFATSGLLLLTNDTRFADWVTDPSNGVPRVYLVTVRGEVGSDEVARACAGVEDSGDLLRADSVEVLKASGRESKLVVNLREGKNRELRRMWLALGHEITRLKRVAFGGLELGELEPGAWRELSWDEVRAAFPGWSARTSPAK